MKKKILVIDNSVGITGAFKSILNITNGLRSSYDFYFAIPPSSKHLHTIITKNHHAIVVVDFFELRKSLSVLLYFPMLLVNSIRLAIYCRRKGIAIVHVNDLYNMTGIVIKLTRPSTKLIYHVRLLSTSYGKRMYKLWVKLISLVADQIIVVSKAVQTDISSAVSHSRVKLIYDFINLDERHDFEPNNAPLVKFLYLANYTKGKGHEFAIQAFSQAITIDKNIRLTFAGGDFGRERNADFKKMLQSDVVMKSLSEYIIFQDISDDIEMLIKMHDVVLNFSESESFSMTCYESLYYGRPIIATRSGGPSELIDHDVTGLLVPNQDVNSMIEAILDLSIDEKKRRFFGVNGKASCRLRLKHDNLIDEMNNIYRTI